MVDRAAIVVAQLKEEKDDESSYCRLAFAVALPVSAFAQDAPPFVKAIAPQAAVSPAWQEWMAVFNPKGALDGKTKELIGLAVAAQIPCQYCIYAHTLGAKHAGATDDQIKEAIAASALVRKMSTELNGNQYDMAVLRSRSTQFIQSRSSNFSWRRGESAPPFTARNVISRNRHLRPTTAFWPFPIPSSDFIVKGR